MAQRITVIVRQHPIACSLYVFYLCCWGLLLYKSCHESATQAAAESLNILMTVFLPFVLLPYLIAAGILATFSKTYKKFYSRLVMMILFPIPIAAFIAMIFHSSIGGE